MNLRFFSGPTEAKGLDSIYYYYEQLLEPGLTRVSCFRSLLFLTSCLYESATPPFPPGLEVREKYLLLVRHDIQQESTESSHQFSHPHQFTIERFSCFPLFISLSDAYPPLRSTSRLSPLPPRFHSCYFGPPLCIASCFHPLILLSFL